tara:strand:+ start:361 stop:891 length:531 start_codon:yes stop_codon:yes gene_type:complete
MKIWTKVKNFENYEINPLGEVRSIPRMIDSNRGYKYYNTGKILKPILNSNGYYMVRLSKNGKVKQKYIHRLIAETLLKNTKDLPEINHKDGNKLNNNLENLEWVSYKQNINHSIESGLTPLGSKRKHSKLNENQVLEIKKLLKEGLSYKEIFKITNVNIHNIKSIKYNKCWKHVIL